MAEEMFFDNQSFKLVKDFLKQNAKESRLEAVSHETQERMSENKAVPCRVPKHLLRIYQTIQNPNIPQVPSLGPYYDHSLGIDQSPNIPQVLSHGPYHYHLLDIDQKNQNPYIPQVLSRGPYHYHLLDIDQKIQNPYIPQVLSRGPYHYHLLDIDQKIQNPYIPQVLSLGPYHFHRLTVKDVSTVLSQLDERMSSTKEASFKLKLESAAAVSGILGVSGRNLEEMFKMIDDMRPDFQSFYNLSTTEGENSDGFALMMVLDSFFLMYFLSSRNEGEQRVDIKCDILKLENQIPLFMLQNFFKIFKIPHNYKLAYSLSNLLERAYEQLSPFDLCPKSILRSINKPFEAALEKEPHLLGCLHAIISPHLEIGRLRDEYPEPTLLQRISRFLNHYVLEKVCAIFFCFTRPPKEFDLIKAYTAGELAMAGIKFKYFFLLSDNIRFDAYSHTVYLPRMTVAPLEIEVLLCNLAALEFVDKKRRKTVTSFLRLMGNFTKTLDDVEILKKSKVTSHPATLTNQDIAEICDRMGSPFCYDPSDKNEYHVKHLKLAIDDCLMDNYHQTKVRLKISRLKIKVRKLYDEFHQQYLSKPWNVVALVVATFILAMNMVQAYCSLWECNSKKPK